MSSLYWDDFERRVKETVDTIKNNEVPKVRRVAVFITNTCNFRCSYCNEKFGDKQLEFEKFKNIIEKHGKDSIIHITGGEPSTVKWLYPYIDSLSEEYRIHLNSNCFLKPPKNIKRLKVSLDTFDPNYFNNIVNHKNAFEKVIENIKYASKYTVTSVTCVLTKENYKKSPSFMKWCRENLPDLYAVFFSVYKGNLERFKFSEEDCNHFNNFTMNNLLNEMDEESKSLFKETITDKQKLSNGIRFPENNSSNPCYLSMSEIVIDPDGNEYRCSHLYRDKVKQDNFEKHEKCLYGCNTRLVKFNNEVERLLIQ